MTSLVVIGIEGEDRKKERASLKMIFGSVPKEISALSKPGQRKKRSKIIKIKKKYMMVGLPFPGKARKKNKLEEGSSSLQFVLYVSGHGPAVLLRKSWQMLPKVMETRWGQIEGKTSEGHLLCHFPEKKERKGLKGFEMAVKVDESFMRRRRRSVRM